MIRRLLAGLIVVGLAVGIWALWPRAGSDPTPTTLPVAAGTTTTTQPTTSTTAAVTTSTTEASHVVTTVEEAEEILRALWFGWFEGIYNQDETRIREVVGTQAMLDAALAAFENLEFVVSPEAPAIQFDNLEVLRSDSECLAVWVTGSAPFVDAPTTTSTSVEVMRWTGDAWALVATWRFREDQWEADCDGELEPLS